ncbi:MAG TPA: hypothetical protein P5249_08395 [Smithellaceae bacterium]|nr:hypothetical protein [Smithellaceae bacterium]
MKTKYTFEKRQKELAKLQKKEAKRAKRQEAKESGDKNADPEQQDKDTEG